MITLDTCVWMNSIPPSETDHDCSRRLFELLVSTKTAIIVPTLLQVEIAATLSRNGRPA
jgi:predicted nucleic acid-binding protein